MPAVPSEIHLLEPRQAVVNPEAHVSTKCRGLCSQFICLNQIIESAPMAKAWARTGRRRLGSERDKGKEEKEENGCLLSTYYMPGISPDHKTQGGLSI